jgi:hypothetical protein
MPPTVASLDAQIVSLEATLSRIQAERAALARVPPHRPRLERPSGVPPHSNLDSSCALPPSFNFSGWRGADEKLAVPWCPASATGPPPSRSLADLARDRHGTVAVLPSLLVPCCAHSGTTFLWRCMSYAFHPQRVCGGVTRRRGNPWYAHRHELWSTAECAARRYLLPGLAGNIEGHWDYRKEWVLPCAA